MYNASSSRGGGASRPRRRWRRRRWRQRCPPPPPQPRRPAQPLPVLRAARESYSVHVRCRRCDDHDYAGPSPRRPPRPSTTSRRWEMTIFRYQTLYCIYYARIRGVPGHSFALASFLSILYKSFMNQRYPSLWDLLIMIVFLQLRGKRDSWDALYANLPCI